MGDAGQDAEIERLERAIAEEREHSAALRSQVDELRFKAEILERSYGKQLEDARRSAETAEQALAEQRTRNAELDAARQDAIELLTETKAEIDRLTRERDQMRRQLASRDGWGVDPGAPAEGESEGGTINTLMDDASWLRKRRPIDEERARAEAARAAAEEQVGEMISPEVVFTRTRDDD
jgi:DNA repair exonuclease SbcCD ATPase subunit